MAFVTDVREFQALLGACSSTREWEIFYLALNINKTHTHTQSGAENSLFQFCLTITKPFLLSISRKWKTVKVLYSSRAVSRVIMRVRKPKVEYKLALQEKPQRSILTYYYKKQLIT